LRAVNEGEGSLLVAGVADAPPIVLVHGLAANSCAWLPVMSRLEAHYRLVAADLPGHGTSRSRFSFAGAVGAISDLCREQASPPTIIGWSLGGLLALRVLANEPTVASALVLTGATIQPGRILGGLLVAASLIHRMGDNRTAKHLASHMMASRLGADSLPVARCGLAPGNGLLALRDVGLGDWCGLASRVSLPVLIANGSRDRIASPAEARFVQAMPHAELARLHGAGHFVPIERPAELASAVDEFLRR
jgi:pimeloyl-ACP methyl ester carboxylesterase